MLILGLFDGVIEDILTAVYSVLIGICGGIYNVAAFAFKIFLILANAEVLEPQTYAILLNNVYALIGVVMLFIIAFALLKMMINSDEQKKSSSTIKKVIINSITSIMLIAILPTIFSFALDFQRSILCSNVIGRIFGIGNLGEMQCDPDNEVRQVQVAANAIVNGVFTSFFNVGQANLVNIDAVEEGTKIPSIWELGGWLFHPEFESINLPQEPPCGPPKQLNSNQDLICAQWNVLPNDTVKTTVLYVSMMYVEQSGDFFHYASYGRAVAKSQIDFNFLVCLIGGLILIYVAVTYCFDMAIRLIKLTFYQIIAPIPILFKIIPEGKLSGMFGNWVKVTITCYLEVFIRIFVLYAVIYMAKAVTNSSFFTEDLWHYGVLEHFFAKAFTYLGLVMFIKQAPKLISEVTGIDSGNMKLGLREKLKESGLFTAGAVVGAGATGFVRNAVNAKQKGMGFWKGAGSTIAGTVSSQFRAFRAGKNAGSFVDMKNAAGKGVSGAIVAREDRIGRTERYHAAGQNFITGHFDDAWTGVKKWAGAEEDYSALQAEQSSADTLLSSVKNIKATSEDYIDKHKSEFYINLNQNQLAELNYHRKLEKEGTDAERAVAKTWLQNFDNVHINDRLDIIEARSAAIKSSGKSDGETDEEYAARIANATNDFNKARKDMIDAFATDVGVSRTYTDVSGRVHEVRGHYGAEKEAIAIQAQLDAINDKLTENVNSRVVGVLRAGREGLVDAQIGNVTPENATKFIKNLKSASEVTSAEITAEREKLERKNKRREGK